MTPEIVHCCHCGRKLDANNNDQLTLIMGGLAVTMVSPLMEEPSPVQFVGGCCAQELAEWIEPRLALDNDEIRVRIQDKVNDIIGKSDGK